MIYVTGDTHGNSDGDAKKLNSTNFKRGNILTKKDFLIICGDYGFVWYGNQKDNWWLNWFNNKPWTTLFVAGNHENYDALNNYPVEIWNGGKVHKIRNSVYHLMNGQVFNIDKNIVFTMGGAKSSDKKYIDCYGKAKERKEGFNWWSQEEPLEEELYEGLENLKKYNNKVDFIISHTCPSKIINVFDKYPIIENQSNLNNYFDKIASEIIFKKWYFGHFHDDINLFKFQMLYNEIIELGENTK